MKKLFGLAVLIGAAVGAQAIGVKFTGVRYTSPVVTLVAPPHLGSYYCSVMNMTLTGTNKAFYALCADLEGTVATNDSWDAPVSGVTASWTTALHRAAAVMAANGMDQTTLGNFTMEQAAAAQIAVWEALYDTSFDASAGDFRISSTNGSWTSILTNAKTYFDAGKAWDKGGVATYFGRNSAGLYQGQMIWDPGKEISSVPEPFTIALCAGALGLALRRRLKKA